MTDAIADQPVDPSSNAFEALCKLAYDRRPRMCWYLRCGTCEHCEFRRAFLNLIAGNRPFTKQWSEASRSITRLPSSALRRPWPWNDQLLLSRILAGASPQRIARMSGFPDWLGYLGLGLAYTETIEREQRSLTTSWVPDLLAMLPSGAPSRIYFEQMLDDRAQALRWRDLARIEKDIMNAKREARRRRLVDRLDVPSP